jgi:hypothetical protein
MSVQLIGAEKLEGDLKRIALRYRKDIIRMAGESVNDIRKIAQDKYIIKRTVPHLEGRGSLWRLYKLQPSDPIRLTGRTGWLQGALRDVPSWSENEGSRRVTKTDRALKTTVTVSSPGVVKEETYRITLSTIENLEAKYLFRFKHEKGLRGHARPFIDPAAHEYTFQFEKKIKEKNEALKGTVTL